MQNNWLTYNNIALSPHAHNVNKHISNSHTTNNLIRVLFLFTSDAVSTNTCVSEVQKLDIFWRRYRHQILLSRPVNCVIYNPCYIFGHRLWLCCDNDGRKCVSTPADEAYWWTGHVMVVLREVTIRSIVILEEWFLFPNFVHQWFCSF